MQNHSYIPSGIIDSHAHVVREFFSEDQQEVIERAFASNVKQLINPGINGDSIAELCELTEKYQEIYMAVGLHPHEASAWSDELKGRFKVALKYSKVVAIGECGLDFYYNNSEPAAQVAALHGQIELAIEFSKPLIIHCRDAWNEIAEIFDQYPGALKGVFHCFTGDPKTVEMLDKYGFYTSFSGIVTFPKAKELQEAAKLVPQDRLMVETDCPFLAPQPVRGKRNEPSYVWHVAEKLAELRGTTVSEIAAICSLNTRKLFGLPDPA
jgi:TatD DNase family protein